MMSRFLMVILAGGVILSLSPGIFSQDFRDQEVDAAIKKAQDFLLSQMNDEGYWAPYGNTAQKLQNLTILTGLEVQFRTHYYPLGQTAIATYALIESGMSPTHPKIAKALDYLVKTPTAATYVLGLRSNAFLAALKRTDDDTLKSKYRQALRQDAEQLIFATTYGGYSYASPGDKARSWAGNEKPKTQGFDNSNSQYGVLGPWAAALDRAEVPRNYWAVIQKHWVDEQLTNGGWDYTKAAGRGARATMTAAGLASLFVCFESQNGRDFLDCKKSELPKSLTRGLEWFDKNYSTFRNQRNGYLLYGIERVGLASGYKYFGEADWYKIGRKLIIERQRADGQFPLGNGDIVGTSYGLLFLARGRNPVIINKLDFHGDWNNRPRDLANLSRQVGKDLERELNWQIINLRVSPEELHDAPILYISGANAPTFSEEELQKLRDFVYQGGLILSVTECNGNGFKNGIREVYAKLFPKYEMQPCNRDHPLYSSHYKIRNGHPAFYEISNGVRPLVLHTDVDLSRAWQLNTISTQKPYFQIVLNILLYTMGDLKALRPRGVSHWPEVLVGDVDVFLDVARLQWTGHCDPEPLAHKRLALMMKKEGGMEITFVKDEQENPMIPISKLAESDVRFAWITGTGELNLSAEEQAALKQFVEQGGVLLIEAAGGNKAFTQSARKMIKTLFSRKLLDIFEEKSPLYAQKDRLLTKASWQKKTRKRLTGSKQFRLEGVLVNDKPAVIFSPEDISAGLLGTPFGTVDGYAPQSAFELMRNMLHYAAEKKDG